MEENKRENIVMFPFMAQGHIIPFLALSLHLEQKGIYDITFLNTPLNIQKLKTSLPKNSSIRLVELPFYPSDHGLPPGGENTDVLPYSLIPLLLHGSLSLKPYFRQFLADQAADPPLCVISDIFFGWSADVAHEFGIFHAVFSGSGGFGLACYHSAWMNLPHRKTNSQEFTMPDFPEAGVFHVTQLQNSCLVADGSDTWSLFQHRNLPGWLNSDAILFNTIEELDHIGLDYFRRKTGRPIWAIGPILLSVENRSQNKNSEIEIRTKECINWLDSKPRNSVLYISFGSQNTISATQMMQLAYALDASKTNFIWIVRPPLEFDINSEFEAEEWLPDGFVKRAEDENRGRVIVKWGPQVEILSHESTGVFLSHCGWNSVLEAMSYGVPMIGWAMAGEQFFNVKLLEEEMVGVCVEVARGTSFEIQHEDVVKKIEMVMGDHEKGARMRRKAGEIRVMIRDCMRDDGVRKGSSVEAMDEFFIAASSMKEMKKKSYI